MNDYKQVTLHLHPCSEDMTDLLASFLAEIGYESFLPSAEGLDAFVPLRLFDSEALNQVIATFPFPTTITHSASTIEGQDWNAEWERNYFKPIVIEGRVAVHSSFHSDVPPAPYDIVIDPKMAFGTGHHATTALLLARLVDTPLQGVRMADVGTGSGILAILAAMRGASVTAIEIDEAAYVNALENVATNGVQGAVEVLLGDASRLKDLKEVDLLVANINRNVITADMAAYARCMLAGASALFSGFYLNDVAAIEAAGASCGLTAEDVTERDGWASVKLTKQTV